MSEANPIVVIIDDDASFRRSTERLVHSAGHATLSLDSGTEFLKRNRPDAPACIVLDVRIPGLSGLDFQKELAKAGISIPLIFVTGHGDIPMSVQAMKAGAFEFLTKPFRHRDLLDAIEQAIESDRAARKEQARLADLRARYESLTPREREVMVLVVAGKLNKQIAAQLETVEKTIKFHRAHVMQKIAVVSVAELVRVAASLELQF